MNESNPNINALKTHFNEAYYLQRYPDVAGSAIDPLEHYLTFGWKEGRDPSASFSTTGYLERYPDVVEAQMNPLVHYMLHGQKEGRSPAPWQREQPGSAQKSAFLPPLQGCIERVDLKSCVGWLSRQPSTSEAELWVNDSLVTRFSLTVERPPPLSIDGQQHAMGYGFEVPISDQETQLTLSRGSVCDVSLRTKGRVLDSFGFSATKQFNGALDKFEDGILHGWAISARHPDDVVEIELLINNRVAFHVRANRGRDDLERLGYPKGIGGFQVSIPFSPSPTERSVTVTARERVTGLRIGKPLNIGPLPTHASRIFPYPPAKSPSPVTVVVTVFDAPDEVAACLTSLLENTQGDVDIVIINDASRLRATRNNLRQFARHDRIRVYRNLTNKGYTASINKGIRHARPGADIILLNSDTCVPPRWVQNLRSAAYSGSRVGTATALSNNAGAFSVPRADHHNELPDDPFEISARRVMQGAAGTYPEVPTGNGFCLYIRRDYLDEVGLFDEAAFPRGYGEENDFCMRGFRLGWLHVVDDKTFVSHTRSASFKAERIALLKEGRAVVDTRFPEYSELVRTHFDSVDLKFIRARSALSLDAGAGLGQPRVLFVISTTTGGTPQTNRDLMIALSHEYDGWLLQSDSQKLTLGRLLPDGDLSLVAEHQLSRAITPTQHASDEYDDVLRVWLWRYSFELIHIRHIAWHGLGLTAVAKAMDIPIVFSIHDYYSVCPTIKLLDDEFHYCKGECTPWTGKDCSVELWDQDFFPRLKGAMVLAWRSRMERMLRDCAAFVTTSQSSAQLIEHFFPQVAQRRVVVIPHGRDFTQPPGTVRLPNSEEKIRIVVPGSISIAKGAYILKRLIEIAPPNYEFHFVGEIHPSLAGLGILHGRYARDNLPDIVRKIAPSVGLILSIWPETYCHTLTELWACGIPVIAFDIGALSERLQAYPGGWLVEEMSAEAVNRQLEIVTSTPAEFEAAIVAIQAWQCEEGKKNTTAAMALQYAKLYRQVMKAETLAGGKSIQP